MRTGATSSSDSVSQQWLPLLLLIALAWIVRVPTFAEPPGRDQGLFMTEASLGAQGRDLYSEVWEHKPPGVIGIYAVAVSVFGNGYRAVQIAHTLAGLLTALLLWRLGRKAGLDGVAATAAGVFYLIFYGGPLFGGFWATAQVEIFVDPLVALALFCIAPKRDQSVVSRLHWCAAGMLIGIAVVWLKYSCFPLLAMGFLAFLKPGKRPRLSGFRNMRAFVLGAMAPGVAMLAYFALTGRLAEFWSATVVFNLAHRQVSASVWPVSAWAHLFPWLAPLCVLYAFSLVGIIACGLQPDPVKKRTWLLMSALLLWGITLGEVFIQGKFWSYHYHVILLPLTLLAALGVQGLVDGLAARVGPVVAWAVCGVVVVLFMTPYASVWSDYAELHGLTKCGESGRTEDAFRSSYRWGGSDYDAAENDQVAARIAAETQPEDSIFVWGFEPSIYFLSERNPASRFLYDYPLLPAFGPLAEEHERQLLADLGQSSPALFVVVRADANDLEPVDSETQLMDHPLIAEYLSNFYRPAWSVGDFRVYRRVD